MVDDIVDASVRGTRLDFRTGVGRRRWWNAADKGRIVAEFAAVAVVWRHPSRPAGTKVGWIRPGLIVLVDHLLDGLILIAARELLVGLSAFWKASCGPSRR